MSTKKLIILITLFTFVVTLNLPVFANTVQKSSVYKSIPNNVSFEFPDSWGNACLCFNGH